MMASNDNAPGVYPFDNRVATHKQALMSTATAIDFTFQIARAISTLWTLEAELQTTGSL